MKHFQQLFPLSIQQGKKQPVDFVKYTWANFSAKGQRQLKDDQTLETAEDNLAELTTQAHGFVAKKLAILKALQIT